MLEKIQEKLKEAFPQYTLSAKEDDLGRGIITLAGQVDAWQHVIDIGHLVAGMDGVRNVVSDMTVRGQEIPQKDYTPSIEAGLAKGEIAQADVVIVGLGITGCAIARELSKYKLKIIAVDMGEDVATAATKANNGGVHMAGQVKPGTLKAKLSVRGNSLYDQWAQELGFEFIRPGALTFVDTYEEAEGLYKEFMVAVKNKDQRPQLIDAQQAYEIEPKLHQYNEDVVAAVWLPSQGKIHPYETAVALIENAVDNGVRVLLDCTVGAVLAENGQVQGVVTNQGVIKADYIINAAGVYSDEVSAMAGDRCYTIHPRKGTIIIMDKNKPPMYDHMTQQYTTGFAKKRNVESKGGGMDLTPAGNILLGPSATEVMDKEDNSTTVQDFEYTMGRNENPNATEADVIRIFAGVRPCDFSEDYVIEMSPVTHGFINAGAVQSPGIGSAPAVAEMVENILKKDREETGKPLEKDPDFDPIRKKPVQFHKLSREEQDKLIQERPEYGRVVCRCETITEGEILDAIHSNVVPQTIDGIKQRVRAGMGRCNGGFCQPRVLEILARELGKDWVEINLKGAGSHVLKCDNRP